MTGYEALMRQHTNASDLFNIDRAAWIEYRRYVIQKCQRVIPGTNRIQTLIFHGDATSHLLFRKFQAARKARDAVSHPRHKQNRFSTRSNGHA